MKARILKLFGIGLTLATLTSMFVVGVPVSAAEQFTGNFDIPIIMPATSTLGAESIVVDWLGAPMDATLSYQPAAPGVASDISKPLPGTVRKTSGDSYKTFYTLDTTGTFGAGTLVVGNLVRLEDFKTKKWVETSNMVFTFDNNPGKDTWEGTLTLSKIVTKDITTWKLPSTTSLTLNTTVGIVEWTFLEGTGDFDNFYFSTTTEYQTGKVFGIASTKQLQGLYAQIQHSRTSATLNWAPVSGATNYKVVVSQKPQVDSATTANGPGILVTLNSGPTAAEVSGITFNTRYYVSVWVTSPTTAFVGCDYFTVTRPFFWWWWW